MFFYMWLILSAKYMFKVWVFPSYRIISSSSLGSMLPSLLSSSSTTSSVASSVTYFQLFRLCLCQKLDEYRVLTTIGCGILNPYVPQLYTIKTNKDQYFQNLNSLLLHNYVTSHSVWPILLGLAFLLHTKCLPSMPLAVSFFYKFFIRNPEWNVYLIHAYNSILHLLFFQLIFFFTSGLTKLLYILLHSFCAAHENGIWCW